MGPHIVRNEGPLGLFKGVDASAARQLVYSGVAWLEQVFCFLHVPSFFFSFWELWPRFFVIAIFRGNNNAYFFFMGRFWKVIVAAEKNPTHAPPPPVKGALRNVRHAEGRS